MKTPKEMVREMWPAPAKEGIALLTAWAAEVRAEVIEEAARLFDVLTSPISPRLAALDIRALAAQPAAQSESPPGDVRCDACGGWRFEPWVLQCKCAAQEPAPSGEREK